MDGSIVQLALPHTERDEPSFRASPRSDVRALLPLAELRGASVARKTGSVLWDAAPARDRPLPTEPPSDLLPRLRRSAGRMR